MRKKISLNSSDPFHINANIKTTNWNVLQVKIVVNAKRKVKIKLININGESIIIKDKDIIKDIKSVVMAKSIKSTKITKIIKSMDIFVLFVI